MESSKNWAVFIHPSTLKLASFVETLLEPVICKETAKKIELGLHEALVNAVVPVSYTHLTLPTNREV